MLVSVYIPTRNRQDLLERAVKSVLSQQYNNLEIIVVDDNSSDNTAEFLGQIASSDGRVRFIRNSVNLGAPRSRNIAILAATGDYVTGLDDDDQFASDRIELFLRAAASRGSRGSHALYSQDIFQRENGLFKTHKPEFVCAEDLIRENGVGSQIFARREDMLKTTLFDPDLPAWQDLEFFLRFLEMNGPAFLVDCATYLYDDFPRQDRISTLEGKVQEACRRCVAMYKTQYPAAEIGFTMQKLLHYNITPSYDDMKIIAANRGTAVNCGRIAWKVASDYARKSGLRGGQQNLPPRSL